MKKLLLAALLFTAILTSCKKESCPIPVPPIDLSGTTFKGTVVLRGSNYDNSILTFKADGSTENRFAGDPNIYLGMWSKTPNSSIINLTFSLNAMSVWKGAGILNSDGTKIENGTYNQIIGTNGTGTFSLTKQ
jgi:hypothetical protein